MASNLTNEDLQRLWLIDAGISPTRSIASAELILYSALHSDNDAQNPQVNPDSAVTWIFGTPAYSFCFFQNGVYSPTNADAVAWNWTGIYDWFNECTYEFWIRPSFGKSDTGIFSAWVLSVLGNYVVIGYDSDTYGGWGVGVDVGGTPVSLWDTESTWKANDAFHISVNVSYSKSIPGGNSLALYFNGRLMAVSDDDILDMSGIINPTVIANASLASIECFRFWNLIKTNFTTENDTPQEPNYIISRTNEEMMREYMCDTVGEPLSTNMTDDDLRLLFFQTITGASSSDPRSCDDLLIRALYDLFAVWFEIDDAWRWVYENT